MNQLTLGSLFSGIGGIDLGFERAGFKTAWQVEINDYCRKVLELRFPHAERFADIRQCGAHNLIPVDVIAGGFPCQDVSYAGFGAGLAGSRSGLFYELARVVSELGPQVVVLENVAALLTRGLREVLGTLADLGLDAEWGTVSGCSMGETHPRQRLFVVAYSNGFDGWTRFWDSDARKRGPIQALDGFARARSRAKARMANPSSLYGGADGVPFGMERNRAIGNAVAPSVALALALRVRRMLQQPCRTCEGWGDYFGKTCEQCAGAVVIA